MNIQGKKTSNKGKNPSLKQQKFITEYLKTGNEYQSAIKAGYSPATAKNAYRNIVEKRGVKKKLSEVGEILWNEDTVKRDIALGKELSLEKGDLGNFRGFCEMQAKCLSMFKDGGNQSISINLRDLHAQITEKAKESRIKDALIPENTTTSGIPAEDIEP